MTNRVEYIDIAKGISIILVALFHSKLRSFAPDFINSMGLFRMPLFFFLSGVFFSTSTDIHAFLWKKSEVLLKPYFVTSLAIFIMAVILKEEHLAWQLKGIFYGNGDTIKWTPMWFLTHLFSVYLFTYFIFKFTNIQEKNTFYKCFFIIILMVIGAHWINYFWHLKTTLLGKEYTLLGLPFSIDIILISSAFFITGGFLKKMVINFNPSLYMSLISVLVFFIISIFTDAHMDLNKRIYINPLLTTVGAVCGIYFIICISYYLNKTIVLRNTLLTLGQASLFILIFHAFIDGKVNGYFIELGENKLEFWFAVIAFFLSISISVLIKTIVLKSKFLSLIYLPVRSKNTNIHYGNNITKA
ncbi:MAG: acyltransferase family protein [Candidatus Endonucleobacter bathymodioli]|uniref:Acyltransferase family protein n=1 Tax=Candidatus Endonucleibacter bathymodioli TaxID=539814 RepID=A0AA90NJV2_9GAMM|nr:acyltransferase family protein [Candidatus Endonucleobacter bathymodioli]